MLFLNLIIVNLCFVAVFSEENCKISRDTYENHLGTKTPYRFIANTTATKLDFEGCKPQKLWMLIRHGTRNPSAELIEKMKERLPQIRNVILENNLQPNDYLRHSDLYALQKWKIKLEETNEKILTHEGEDEMLELAERMQSRFPTLLPPTYSNTTFYFKYTASQRAKASAKYFAAGLFGRQTVRSVWFPKPLKHDPVLRFYKLCSKWKSQVKDNPETLKERTQFENNPNTLKIIDMVNKKLNLKSNKLSLEDVHLIFMTCAFETAWNRQKKSAWCSVLTPEAVKAMEFAEDLKYYYRDGYGYELTYKQACTAFNDVINFFQSKSSTPKATVYFSHSGTLLKILAHLGLYKDSKPLKHNDFGASDEHKWKVSKIDAFGSNIAFVLYSCEESAKVLIMHQEQIVQLPNCYNELCDFSDIKYHYRDSINDCKFNEMCNNT